MLPWLLPTALMVAWQLASWGGRFGSGVIPSPLEVVDAGVELLRTGQLQHHVLVSLRRAALGFGLGASLGFSLGVAVGLSSLFRGFVDLTVQMLRTIPHLALVPLMIAWFGIGEEPRVLLVALGVLFPVYINTAAGIRTVDHRLVEMGRSYGLGRHALIISVILPGAMPQILTGVRYALGVAWLTLVVAESIASREGLGFLVQDAREMLRLDVIVLAIILYALAGWLTDRLTRAVERRLLRWHPGYAPGAPS